MTIGGTDGERIEAEIKTALREISKLAADLRAFLPQRTALSRHPTPPFGEVVACGALDFKCNRFSVPDYHPIKRGCRVIHYSPVASR